ncbi:hypothetical protein HQ545_08880 [Candidatus Woesearchaeota archaeon]|nr:hypothetical protein [Candidatus Woesearchaeota archaeon]
MQEIPKAVKKDLLYVLNKAQKLINKGDSKQLKHISDQTIQNASVFQDKDSLTLAVVIYAISKLLERYGFESEYAEEERNLLGSAYFSLEQDNYADYRDKMKHVMEFTARVEKEFKLYIEQVLEKALVKKGGGLYERGISMARAAELLGIGQWELMSYIGKTRIHDEVDDILGVEQRIEFARSLFK